MGYVLDTSAILSVLFSGEGAEKVVELLKASMHGTSRVLVPFTAMGELEVYLLRRVSLPVDRVLALVEGWAIEIVESYPQWRHHAVRLQTTLNLPPSIAWASSLALLHNARLVYQDPAFDGIPGVEGIRLP